MIQKKFFNKKNKNTKRRLYIFLKFIYWFSDVSLKDYGDREKLQTCHKTIKTL